MHYVEINKYIKDNPHVSYPVGAEKCGLSESAYEKRYRRTHHCGIKSYRKQNKETPEQAISQLEETCKRNGINVEDVKHFWFKSEKFSIFAKNKIVTYDQMRDDLVRELKAYSPKFTHIKRKKITDGHLLVVDPADVHIGKLSVEEETGQPYGIEIAKQRCIEGVEGLLQKSSGFPLEKIMLVIGNDIIHTDTTNRQTTSGTPQDTDGMWWQMFKEAKNLYIKIVEMLITEADVHIVFNPSNHDYMTGFMLADTLQSWFRNSKNVTFEISIKHRKYYQYGKNLICTSHGDGAKSQDMPLLMASEAKHMWADTNYRYIYLHHLHHKIQFKWMSGKDYQGATVEYLRSPSASDSWHDRKGYTASPKAIEGFIHHPTQGQVCRVTHYF